MASGSSTVAESEQSDSVVRALTSNHGFRVIAASTTRTVRGAVAAQAGRGQTARHFGDLLTGAVLFRETMAPRLRVQCILRGGDGVSTLVADSHPSGNTRGLIQLGPDAAEFGIGNRAVVQMMRTLPNGRIQQGLVRVPVEGSISQALMVYMQESEQVVTMLAIGTLLDGPSVEAAGGYLVQLLPDAPRAALREMADRLKGFERIDAQLSHPEFGANWLLGELLHELGFSRLEETPIRFQCWCSDLGVVSALATVGRDELRELVAGGEPLEIRCDYCGQEYRVSPARLQGLLKRS